MARYSWKGTLRLSLVSVPVQAFNAQESGSRGKIALHQLHAKDHSRIRYVKVCPQHGEVPPDEIVSGYEVSKDEYVLIEPAELDELRTPRDKAITLDSFIAPTAIEPRYYTGRNYFLLPDGDAAAKPYTVLHRAMSQQKRWGIGQGVMFGREHLILVRPEAQHLVASVLYYANELRAPEKFDTEGLKISATELRLAETLIKASSTTRFAIDDYEDEYEHKLRMLIEAKVKGRDLVTPPTEDEPVVVNLMDALRASVAKAQQRAPAKRRAKPAKRLAVSRPPAAAKRRKSS